MSGAAIGDPVGARAGVARADSDPIGVDDRRSAGPRNHSSSAIECSARLAAPRSLADARSSVVDMLRALRATTAG
jgi:hypothetical protein